MNVTVSDQEYQDMKTTCDALGEKVEDKLKEFCQVIQSMIDSNEMEGTAADNILLYTQRMKESLATYFNETLDEQGSKAESFVSEIDEADSFLY